MSFPLNNAQREAVRHVDGPLLVLAGAGSGKTRVIAAKIGHLLEHGRAPDTIAAILEWSVEGRAATVALAPISAVLTTD